MLKIITLLQTKNNEICCLLKAVIYLVHLLIMSKGHKLFISMLSDLRTVSCILLSTSLLLNVFS